MALRLQPTVIVLLSALFSSCDTSDSGLRADLMKLQSDLQSAQTDMKKHADALDALSQQVNELSSKADLAEFSKKIAGSASFDPSERGFARVDHSLGFFLVSLENVQPYGDGQQVTLHVGNPIDATFLNVELQIVWSARFPTFNDEHTREQRNQAIEVWRSTRKTKTITLDKKLLPGSWNPVQFVVAPAPAAQFGDLTIQAVKTTRVEMRK